MLSAFVSNRLTKSRPLPKLLGNKSRDRMGRTHSNAPRNKPTPGAAAAFRGVYGGHGLPIQGTPNRNGCVRAVRAPNAIAPKAQLAVPLFFYHHQGACGFNNMRASCF
jgi:hypothetical protein